ncbi:TetR/AcrR family transcriptional regulator [Sphingomonas sp. MG17]|uniref:TetR/AcrR family transcriptional regulator n=1 Tax=Sphingomonas tagetis TaxID=2949092 RepID=A0A9X2HUA0_9SPHN|nr:TetR/AcrR family transcriptional regulator [Sphingomonas tagetis]MCP3732740.1 TetR/AcrR family transcriptional regulator [Sphingomonas tagetis]
MPNAAERVDSGSDMLAERDAETLSTRDWINAAKALLIREGIDAVKVDRIARMCGVTRGGFYWRFRNRAELLDELLNEWVQTNTTPLLDALNSTGTPAERFERVASLWLEETQFDPRFDTAVRGWAVHDARAADVVRRIDQQRVDAFVALFLDAGYDPTIALVRARTTYFLQVGYYALALDETREARRKLRRAYSYVLTGFAEFADPEGD